MVGVPLVSGAGTVAGGVSGTDGDGLVTGGVCVVGDSTAAPVSAASSASLSEHALSNETEAAIEANIVYVRILLIKHLEIQLA